MSTTTTATTTNVTIDRNNYESSNLPPAVLPFFDDDNSIDDNNNNEDSLPDMEFTTSQHQQRKGANINKQLSSSQHQQQQDERFTVKPNYAYPRKRFTREELHEEMNKSSSYFHDLRRPDHKKASVGTVHIEVLQCFGLPWKNFRKKSSAFSVIVCDRCAFKSDVLPPVSNPMWLSKMRRACIFSLDKAYTRIYVGVFSKAEGKGSSTGDRFIGRIVLDVCRLRPGTTYDVTLPLRLSNQVYSRTKRGAIRIRIHLEWKNETAALMSYLPESTKPQLLPHHNVTVRCADSNSFANVARVVHGADVSGKFSMKLAKATTREINYIRINIMRYVRKREIRNISQWRYPIISCFIFVAWMHSVYVESMKFCPGHFITYLLLTLWKNYYHYVLSGKYDSGFLVPTVEEMVRMIIFGTGIEPLDMEEEEEKEEEESKEEGVEVVLSEIDNVARPQPPSLQEIAKKFKVELPRSRRRRIVPYLRGDLNTFLAKDAVDYLVDKKYATSRKEAVELGRRMQRELRLFDPLDMKRRKQSDFKDSDQFFVFTKIGFSQNVSFKTHEPWFRSISALLFSGNEVTSGTSHMEFPFADDAQHPRFTVNDSLVLRPRESAIVLANTQEEEDDDDDEEEEEEEDRDSTEEEDDDNDDVDLEGPGTQAKEMFLDSFASSVTDILKTNSNSSHERRPSPLEALSLSPMKSRSRSEDELDFDMNTSYEDMGDQEVDTEENNIELHILSKPPNQDMNFVLQKKETLPEILSRVSHQVHKNLGHLFHDKVYRIRSETVQRSEFSNDVLNQSSNKKQLFRKNSSTVTSSVKSSRMPKEAESREDTTRLMSARKDQYDKLLRCGKYSSSNVIMKKVAAIVQPIIEICQTYLAFFRAVFNIMTWQDPFLTFWIACFGIVLVPILHIFPWRIVLGVTGIVFVGPQNWLIRVVRERNNPPSLDDFDVVARKKVQDTSEDDDLEGPIFSNYTSNNRPVSSQESTVPTSDIKEVAVPRSQLMYRRCYDWPPEPEYVRVKKCTPPKNDDEVEQLFDQYSDSMLDIASDHGTWENDESTASVGKRGLARRIVNKSVQSVKNGPIRFRGRRRTASN